MKNNLRNVGGRQSAMATTKTAKMNRIGTIGDITQLERCVCSGSTVDKDLQIAPKFPTWGQNLKSLSK